MKVLLKVGSVFLGLSLVVTAACKKSPSGTESAVSDAPQKKEELFIIPPAAKKQAKYFPEDTPSRAIQDLDDMLDSYILNPATPQERQYNVNLKRAILHGTFDIRELCRLALDKHWGEQSRAEQDHFVDIMIRLLEKKAIFSKEQGLKKSKNTMAYKVTYEGHRFLNPLQDDAVALSTVHIPSEDLKIGLHYKLKRIEGKWRIYDVIVDGASLLNNYKYEFDRIIKKEGYPDLVHRMESKLKELEIKETSETP